MRRRVRAARLIVGSVSSLAVVGIAPAAAQVRLADGVGATLSARLHTQFNTTSVEDADGAAVAASEFLVRRARLTLDIRLSDFLTARIEPDYGTGSSFSLRDAYVRFTVAPAFRATVGQFKRPFDLFELTSANQILVVERAGDIRGVNACGALETVCSLGALTETLLYADRDLGVMIDGELPGRAIRYAVAVTNGQPVNTRETNDNKSVTARLWAMPLRDVVLGASIARKDYRHPTSGAERFATAWDVDLEIGNFVRGPHVQAGVVGGGNWLVGTSTEDVAGFAAAQVIATWKIPVAHRHLTAIEPVGRVSWADPDTETADDGGLLLTPGLSVYLGRRTKLATNVDVWRPQSGASEWSFKSQMFFFF